MGPTPEAPGMWDRASKDEKREEKRKKGKRNTGIREQGTQRYPLSRPPSRGRAWPGSVRRPQRERNQIATRAVAQSVGVYPHALSSWAADSA